MLRLNVFFYFSFYFLFPSFSQAQIGSWVWIKGADTVNSTGNFGVMGTPSSFNEPPGLDAVAFWTDTGGNLWVYGGKSIEGSNTSLWKLDPITTKWTWIKGSLSANSIPIFAAPAGVFNPNNEPGWQGSAITTWTDKQNHLWMYGGFNGIQGLSSNLWQYDPDINEWAWMAGGMYADTVVPVYGTKGVGSSGNTPGGRVNAGNGWVDTAGNLWLFGGSSLEPYNGGFLIYPRNDMWQYNISTGMWIWMSGSSAPNDPGSYDLQGTPSINSYPSARSTTLQWQDSQGNFWLAGGKGFLQVYYTDVWKFNPVTLEWTWIKGSASPDTTNIASGLCSPNINNQQGGRIQNSSIWKICDDLVLNYGGVNNNNGIPINDFWGFLPVQNEWLKINEYPSTGIYGDSGVASTQNYPPARFGSCSFIDKKMNLWMFGGAGVVGNENIYYNDLWKYVLDTTCLGNLYCNETATSITNIPNQENISIYPNPLATANWQLKVDYNLLGSEAEILDESGRVVYKSQIEKTHSEISAQLAGGVYLLRITSGATTITRKLVKL